MKKYSKIYRYGKRETLGMFENSSDITVWEKLDGANSSFSLVDGELKCFSRNQELDSENNLRGFYQWVTNNINKEHLEEGLVYYGEWLVKHTINYPEEAYNNFYLFDVYDTHKEVYSNFKYVKSESERLGLTLCPVFYHGDFQSLDHINSFVGKSKIGDVGEGVVVKNYDFINRFGNQSFAKIVSDTFAEKAKTKKQKLPQHVNELDGFVETYLTKPRVEKMLYKLVDEGVIEEDFGLEDMGTILKNSGKRVIDDILEEELDSLINIVKRKIGKEYPHIVREVVEGK